MKHRTVLDNAVRELNARSDDVYAVEYRLVKQRSGPDVWLYRLLRNGAVIVDWR